MITHEINMDLQFRGVAPVIDAVQGESLSRSIKINLFSAGQPWEMPDGASAALRYRKTDGKGGIYSNLPDGTEAWEVDGNSVTILLINQVLNVPGAVVADMIIIQADSVLATFPLAIRVSPAPSADVVESDNYFGIPLDDTLTVSGAAADAAAVGVRFGDMESRLERFQEKFDETDEKLENVESAAQAAADMAVDAAERQEALEQALLQKIEDLGSSRVAKSGDTMTGSLDLGGNDLQNVGTAQLQALALLPPNDPDGELGVNAYAEAAILGEDGHPTGQVLSFYGIFNDEPAVLRNVHDPVMDTDAVPKGYLEQYMNTHGGAAEVHVGGDEPDADSVQLWLDTDEEASSGSVTSVNGKTGAVELTAEDVGALPNTTVIPVVPDALPNPSKLILTGAVEAEYDGSQEVTVEIPAGGSGGSGGIDLGMTGAAVGQIAKITAVDDNGVPTAWEPVEISGGDVWEHICDISVSVDDALTSIKQDLGGDYKKLLIYINKGSAGGIVTGYTDSFSLSIGANGKEIGRAKYQGTQGGWTVYYFIAEWFGEVSRGNWYHCANANEITPYACSRTYAYSTLSLSTDKQSNGKVIPFETFTIKIYGVRV